MAFDAFLKIDGVEGDALDDKHKNEIRVLGFSSDIYQPASDPSHAGDTTVGRASFGLFNITKLLDKASPLLALACASGQTYATVRLELCRAGGDKQPYMEYKLTDAKVCTFKPSGQTDSDNTKESLPREEVAFSYSKIEWKYTQTGSSSGNVAAGWNLAEDKKV